MEAFELMGIAVSSRPTLTSILQSNFCCMVEEYELAPLRGEMQDGSWDLDHYSGAKPNIASLSASMK